MDAEERQIFQYLKSWKQEFVSVREICRRAAGKERYRENQNWAKPFISRMMERGILESDDGGRYRIKLPKQDRNDTQRWIAPHIAAAFKSSGKDFGTIVLDEAEPDEEYFDKL